MSTALRYRAARVRGSPQRVPGSVATTIRAATRVESSDGALPLHVLVCAPDAHGAGLVRAAAAQRTFAFERARLAAAGREAGGAWERHVHSLAADAWEVLESKLATKPVECFAAVAEADDALDEELMRAVGSALRVVEPRGICVASCDVTYDERLYGEALSGMPSSVDDCGADVGPSGRRATPRKAFVSDVSVLPQVRRRGVATAMLARVMEHARARADVLYVHVDEGNDAARALYARAGFVEEQRESVQEAARRAGRSGADRRLLLRAMRWAGHDARGCGDIDAHR